MMKNFDVPNYFIQEYMHQMEYMGVEELEKYLRKVSGNSDDKVYFMGETYIGSLMMEDALTRVVLESETAIVYLGNGVAYYRGEQMFGPPPRFLLIKK
ncbi:MAG: hypothetical protein PHC41_03350 [Lachnospiraceae bacterium]|nr:hypothetical protein [Lachnospiraceae bacterium]MDD3615243.1 hypothetical protein [Lachnospiraceae bacterium]